MMERQNSRQRPVLPVGAIDLLALVGVGLLFGGLWLISPALALIVVGALLLVLWVLLSWRSARSSTVRG